MDFEATILMNPEYSKLALAALLGALLGLERELSGKDPSLRTFALISLGSCCFAIISGISAEGFAAADPGRVSAQIVTGIGFLGAGAIFRSKQGVQGLTTAALMWLTASVGLAVGLGRPDLGIGCTVIGLAIVVSLKMVHRLIRHLRPGFYDEHQTDFD